MTPEEFRQKLLENGFDLTDKQMQQFELYYKLLVEWNQKMNLTAITEKSEVYLKHFYDSLTVVMSFDAIPEQLTLCDVGSGAGFPSIPLKILFPNWHITIVDSLKKRIHFLETVVETLELEEVSLYHDRAEIFGKQKAFREQFDIVTARAVARLNVLAELCLPLVKVGGQFIAMKAAEADKEIAEAQQALTLLGGEFQKDQALTLPKTKDQRHLLSIQKIKATPQKYPRKPGTPNKHPLI